MSSRSFYIVEDDHANATILRMKLELHEQTIAGESDNYEDALVHLLKTPVDVILMDIHLNGPKTGVDLAQTLRENNVFTPIIFTTAASDHWLIENLLREIKHLEPCSCVHKPISFAALNQEIQLLIPS